MRKYIQTIFMALALLVMSFSANAVLNPPTNIYGWVAPPSNATDIAIQQVAIDYHDGANKYIDVWFYNQTEHLNFVRKTFVVGDPKYGKQYWYMRSGNTQIGYSYYRADGSIGNKIWCPDGLGATAKRHISILTVTFPNWEYMPRQSDGMPCGYVPPANQTSLATVQAAYPLYQVTRLYPNEDIFKVYCVSGACNQYRYWIDTTGYTIYLSNMLPIGQVLDIYSSDLNQYVRAPETTTIQSARDDIAVLATTYFGGYVTWVLDSSPSYIRWW